MFTGIVEQIGRIRHVSETSKGRRLTIHSDGLGTIPIGASLSVSGVCLTAVSADEDSVTVDVVPETLTRTNLDSLRAGDELNLERAMPAGGRFDGHIVQGHVDGVGEVIGIDDDEDGVTMTISSSEHLERYLVEKGSVTVDGVSLTLAAVAPGSFTVALIPHTLQMTTLGLRKTGDLVNLEVDVLAKYVERLLGKQK